MQFNTIMMTMLMKSDASKEQCGTWQSNCIPCLYSCGHLHRQYLAEFPPSQAATVDNVYTTAQNGIPCHLTTYNFNQTNKSEWLIDWAVFYVPSTQYRLYGRRFLQVKRPNQQYQSTEGESCKGKQHKNIKKTENTHTHTHTHKVYK